MNWVDVAIVIFVIGITFIEMNKGLLVSVSSLVCLIISVFIAKTYYKVFTVFLIQNTNIEERILKFLADKNILEDITKSIGINNSMFPVGERLQTDIGLFITVLIVNALSMICIFILARILLSIVEGFLKGASKLPGLKEINNLGGAALGFAKSVLILLLIFTVLIPLSNIGSWTMLRDGIQSSFLAQILYSYNFILGWIWKAALDLIIK